MPNTFKILSSNSIRAVMGELVPQFERASGMSVSVSYDPAKVMLARIAKGETGDLAITGSGAIDELVKQGKILAGSRRLLARCRVGVAVRAGAPKPDISTVDALKRALIAAKSVAYTQEGASGMHFSGLIERMGIAEQIKAKAVRQPGGLIGELVAAPSERNRGQTCRQHDQRDGPPHDPPPVPSRAKVACPTPARNK